jgi:multidrug efflux pump subunit AcrB
VQPSLPAGVEVVTTYDRSELIEDAIDTVTAKLIEEMIIVSIIILVFLWHFPSSLVPIITIPISVGLAFIPMKLMGMNANLMSLAGIAISTGVLVDGAIVEVENAYNKIYHWQAGGRRGDFHEVRLAALTEVGPGVFFSLLVIAVAFLPIFTLVDQEGRLFKPLAFSKNLTMAIAAVLAITLDPALRMLFARDRSLPVPAALAGQAGHRDRGRALPQRGAPPDQPDPALAVRAAVPVRGAPRLADHRRSRWRWWRRRSRSTSAWARSSCRRCARARSCTCRRRCSPACRWPRRSGRSSSRTRSCGRSPRSSGSSARPVARPPRPIRRRSR